MSTPIFIFTASLLPLTILLVFAMRSVASVMRARARLANDDAYRQIAERAATAESETATSLSAIQEALSDVRTRLTSVEKILKEVE